MGRNEGRGRRYTCNEYREEMILAALRKRLQQVERESEEYNKLLQEIAECERRMGL